MTDCNMYDKSLISYVKPNQAGDNCLTDRSLRTPVKQGFNFSKAGGNFPIAKSTVQEKMGSYLQVTTEKNLENFSIEVPIERGNRDYCIPHAVKDLLGRNPFSIQLLKNIINLAVYAENILTVLENIRNNIVNYLYHISIKSEGVMNVDILVYGIIKNKLNNSVKELYKTLDNPILSFFLLHAADKVYALLELSLYGLEKMLDAAESFPNMLKFLLENINHLYAEFKYIFCPCSRRASLLA